MVKYAKRMENLKFFVKLQNKIDWKHGFSLDCDCKYAKIVILKP